jgi:hypothetical protein
MLLLLFYSKSAKFASPFFNFLHFWQENNGASGAAGAVCRGQGQCQELKAGKMLSYRTGATPLPPGEGRGIAAPVQKK